MRDRRGRHGPASARRIYRTPGYHWNHKLPKVAPVVPGTLLHLGDGVYSARPAATPRSPSTPSSGGYGTHRSLRHAIATIPA